MVRTARAGSQFGDVQQAFDIGDPIKREQPLFVIMPPDGVPGESREVWVQLLKTVNGLADGTREWRNCFLATARGLVFETSVLETCVLVLRCSQQRYHGIIGVAVDDIAGGRDEVWEQAISKLKERFTFGHWEVENGRFCSREVVQAADGSVRVGRLAEIKSLDFVPLGKMRKEQSGAANETEKVAMRQCSEHLGIERVKVDPTCQDLFQFCKVVSTGRQTYKKPTRW